MNRLLPHNLTSYDFLKTFALALMVVDHVGYYFFPENDWLRVVGRLSAPIWLFLVGYARSRDFSTRMWVAILILSISNFVLGLAILPLNILATILAARLALDPLMNFIRQKPITLYPICVLLFAATIPVSDVLEYGTEVMMIVMLGYMVRNRDSLPFTKSDITQFTLVAATSHIFYQTMVFFTFTTPQLLVVAVGVAGIMLSLTKFQPLEYPVLTARLPGFVTAVLQFCGRRTLEIYVFHIVLFGFVSMALGYPGFSLFSLHIFR